MKFTKDYIADIKNLNEVDIFNSELRGLFIDKVKDGFEEIRIKNNENGLEILFIESLKVFNKYDVDICFTHLAFLINYCEESNIDKFESIEFNNQVVAFYEYLKFINRYSFFHIARVITYISEISIGEALFKNIIFDVNNMNDHYIDGTSKEYFKMYMEELLSESKTFKAWMDSNAVLFDFIR